MLSNLDPATMCNIRLYISVVGKGQFYHHFFKHLRAGPKQSKEETLVFGVYVNGGQLQSDEPSNLAGLDMYD